MGPHRAGSPVVLVWIEPSRYPENRECARDDADQEKTHAAAQDRDDGQWRFRYFGSRQMRGHDSDRQIEVQYQPAHGSPGTYRGMVRLRARGSSSLLILSDPAGFFRRFRGGVGFAYRIVGRK